MNKKFLLFLIAIFIAIFYLFSFEKVIYKELLSVRTSVQNFYLNIFVYTSEALNKYFNQLDYIDQLRVENQESKTYKTLYESVQKELQRVEKNNLVKNIDQNSFEKVQVLSYVKFNDFSKVILDYDPLEERNRIQALVTFGGFSAGIVLYKEEHYIAFLNENNKCNYTVFIGDDNNPGITSGVDDNGRLVIKYVPIWKEVQLGDEVITSSMDNIFPYGVKVGKVVDFEIQDNMQLVFVEPYANALSYKEFFIYTKKVQSIESNTTVDKVDSVEKEAQ
jgi:rod shape-determining protein MreC